MDRIKFLIASALLLVATLSQAAEVVGRVGYMNGSLLAQRADGTVKVMGAKAEVLAGDALVTAQNSYAQIHMNDGAKMTLRPNTYLKIDDYRFNRQEPESDNAVFSLFKGGLRTVTGLIGKRGNQDAYKMQSATTTIGIRGTDFSSRLCATPNCQDDMAASAKSMGKPQAPMPQAGATPPPAAPDAAPPGLYVTVHNGQVVMAQAGNTLNLARGETGFASPAALVRLPAPPAFMNADTKQTNAIEAKAAKEESKSGGKADEGKSDGKADKEKPDAKPDDEKKDEKVDKEKSDDKSDEDKKDGKQDKPDSKSEDEKKDGKADKDKPEGEKDSGKQGGEKESGKSGSEQESGKPEAGGKSGAAKESIKLEEMNADSPDPTINQSGCVVQ